MANDWIKMRMNLADDPAVIGIAARLKLDRFSVVGRLQTLWSWADEHSADGFLPYVTAAVIDAKLDRRGFTDAMVAVGWLNIESDGVRFPHFDRHNGESAKKRALAMERQRDKRERENAQSSHAESGGTSRGQRDKSVTREEKRREELSSGGGPSSSPGAPAFGTLPEAAPEPPPPPRDKIVDASDLLELQARFPLVDVARERAKARAYVCRERGPEAEVELRFFAEVWLPKAPARSESQQAVAEKKAAASDEPEGWQEFMDTNFPDWVYATGRDPGARKWAEHTTLTQKFVRDSMTKGGAK